MVVLLPWVDIWTDGTTGELEFDYTFEDTGLNSIDAYKARVLGGRFTETV